MRGLFVPLILISLLTACTQSNNGGEQALQNQIDSLKTELDNAYQPGFGDFMGKVQNRHAKLWFAGVNENWELAEFEMHELEEVIEDIRTVYPNREETQSLPIIEPSLETVNNAIKQRDAEAFQKGYLTLTNACNSCHQATKVEFIRIKTPTIPPHSNQDFKQWINEMKNNLENNEN